MAGSYEGVGDGDLVEPLDCGGSVDRALPRQVREPPTLAPVFGELGISDRAPRFA
jgi:hypothetical protein